MRPDELIDKLGGSAKVAAHFNLVPHAVGNWRKRGFPAWALRGLSDLCAAAGIDPGDALIAQPPRRARAA